VTPRVVQLMVVVDLAEQHGVGQLGGAGVAEQAGVMRDEPAPGAPGVPGVNAGMLPSSGVPHGMNGTAL